jgi:multidrug efflux pump
VTRLENGPPVGYPMQFRVSGEHIDRVQAIAQQVAAKVRANPHVTNVNLDWDEPSKVVRLQIDQDRARALGVSTAQVSHFLSSSLSGLRVSTYREGNELIEILLRGPGRGAHALDLLGSLAVPTASGSVPLSQIATLEYAFEDGIIWHRNRLPTVTVRADINGDGDTAPTVVAQILPTLDHPCHAAAGLSAGSRRHGGGFGARAEVDQGRHAAVPAGGDHAADAAAAQLLAHRHGVLTAPLG